MMSSLERRDRGYDLSVDPAGAGLESPCSTAVERSV
jgi:hypothetical protein